MPLSVEAELSTVCTKPLSIWRVLVLSRYTLLSMLLGTIPLTLVPQGRDIISALADEGTLPSHRVFFYITLSLWAVSVWYWSRVLLDGEHASHGATEYQGLARYLPRVLGALTLLLPAIPLWAADNMRVKAFMIVGCAVLAGLFWVFVTMRRVWFALVRPAIPSFVSGQARRSPAFAIACTSLIVSLSLFGCFVWAPLRSGAIFGPVAILFIAAANTVFLGGMTVFASQQAGIHLDGLALVCAAVFSFWNDNHRVEVESLHLTKRLPTLEEQYQQWQDSRDEVRPASPVIVVAAEGGGVRAAYWTASVLASLAGGNPGLNPVGATGFAGRLFAVSGISGGTLGSTVYAALIHDGYTATNLGTTAQTVLGHDFLSPIVAKMVSGDFLQWFLPWPVHAFDRSTAIEESFRRAYQDVTGHDTFNDPIVTLSPTAKLGVPALVMNATVVETGHRAIVAPFTWLYQIPQAVEYTCWVGTGQVDDAQCAKDPSRYAAPRLAKAVHNSARFTYISPAGQIRPLKKLGPGEKVEFGKEIGRVVDGGYFDPTGIESLADILAALRAANHGTRFVPVYVTNGTIDPDGVPTIDRKDAERSAPLELLGGLFAPVRALFETRNAHAQLALDRLRADPNLVTFGFCPLAHANSDQWVPAPDGQREEEVPQPPLGWFLSPEAQARIRAYWQCPVNQKGVDKLKHLIES